jgi:glutamate synthase domain-containing protein 3
VLDETGDFVRTQCNTSGVDLEPVMDTEDIGLIHNLVRRHVELTESPRGAWILENWSEMVPKFVKVFPHEYKRVLGIPRASEAVKVIPIATPSPRVPVHGD